MIPWQSPSGKLEPAPGKEGSIEEGKGVTEGRKKLLILGAGVGSGHMRAAQALEAVLSELPVPLDVQVVDLLERGSPLYRLLYRSGYLALARHTPRILDRLYGATDRLPPALSGLLSGADRLFFRTYLRELFSSLPDLVLCTHFLPLEILAPLRGLGSLSSPLWGLVTDLHPHGIWLWKGVDRYFTADGASASLVRKRLGGTPSSAYGIPVHPDFLKPPDRKGLLERLALPDRKTVLILSGGEGLGNLPSVLDSFSGFPGELSLIAIAGRNAGLLEECRRWAETHENRWLFVRTLGFVENMAEWMAVSDIVVTKPGGITLFEAMALGKPLLLLPARGGQEEINRRWAIGVGAAVASPETPRAGSLLRAVLSDADRLRRMGEASERAGSPEAAGRIAREIVDFLFSDNLCVRRTP